MSNLYDPETDGSTGGESECSPACDLCGGTKTIWFGANGYDFEYPCPRCQQQQEAQR